MKPGFARAPRRGRRCSSTSRSFTIDSACTRPWATEPRPRLAPAWRGSPCARQPDILISPLHTKGGGPVMGTSGDEARDEGAEESFAPAACVVHELEEAEVERQRVL